MLDTFANKKLFRWTSLYLFFPDPTANSWLCILLLTSSTSSFVPSNRTYSSTWGSKNNAVLTSCCKNNGCKGLTDFHILSVIWQKYKKLTEISINNFTHMKSYALLAQLVEALHRFCRGFGFKSRTGLNFFLALFYYCLSSVHYCEDRFQIKKFPCLENRPV